MTAETATPMTGESVARFAEEARQLGCAALVDAMGRLYRHRAHLPPLSSPDPNRSLFGPAATIAYLPYREDLAPGGGFGQAFHDAIAAAPPAAVLVLSSGGYPEVSHGGAVKLTRAVVHELGGVLADGRLRDFAELRAQGLPVWCQGEAVRWGGDAVVPAMANLPITVSGVRVEPGDFVYAETAGGVVIPAGSLEAVFATARAVTEEDRSYVIGIRNEDD